MATIHRHRQPALYKDIEKIKDALSSATLNAKDMSGQMLSDSLENIKDKSYEMKDKMANYTAKKPFKSLSATFIFGVILGYLIHKQ